MDGCSICSSLTSCSQCSPEYSSNNTNTNNTLCELCNVSCTCYGYSLPWDNITQTCSSTCGDGFIRLG